MDADLKGELPYQVVIERMTVGYKDQLCNEFLKNMKHTCNSTVLNEWYDISYFNDDIERNCLLKNASKINFSWFIKSLK